MVKEITKIISEEAKIIIIIVKETTIIILKKINIIITREDIDINFLYVFFLQICK